MSLSDPLGDMLTRIRNGQKAGKATIVSPASKVRASVLDVLKREGYIRGYQQSDGDSGGIEFRIELKYHEGHPVIREISRVSRPGRRGYFQGTGVPPLLNRPGLSFPLAPACVLAD